MPPYMVFTQYQVGDAEGTIIITKWTEENGVGAIVSKINAPVKELVAVASREIARLTKKPKKRRKEGTEPFKVRKK